MLRAVRVSAPALAALVLGFASPVPAQSPEPADARLNATRIGLEDELQLTISAPEARGGPPELPALEGFEVLGSQRVSRTEIVNMNMTRATDWIYTLRPLETGNLEIPPIAVPGYADTRPLTVEVVPGSLRPRAAPGFPDPFSFGFDPFRRGRREPREAITEEDVFVRVEAPLTEVFEGEQVLVLYRLYSRLPVFAAGLVESAQPEGFWTEEIELPDVPWAERGLSASELRRRRALPGPRREAQTVNGVRYDTWPLLMRAVFPTGAGPRELAGPRFEVGIEGATRSFFGPEQLVVTRTAPPVTIHARPLPESGRPPGFTGAVGAYRLTAGLLREGRPVGDASSPAGEPLVLRMALSGRGNLGNADAPAMPLADAARRRIRFFDPDTRLQTGLVAAGEGFAFGGERVWEIPLVAEAGGLQRIGAATLDVFNPETGAYEEVASDPLAFRIEGGAAPVPGGGGPAAVERLGQDIRYLKPVGPGRGPDPGPWRPGALLVIGLTLPVVWNLALVAVLRRRAYRAAHAEVFLRRGAARAANRRLDRISGEGAERLARIGAVLAGYASERLSAPAGGLTPDAAADRFRAAGAADGTAARFAALLSRLEGARFAARRAGAARDRALEEARALIGELEGQLGRAA